MARRIARYHSTVHTEIVERVVQIHAGDERDEIVELIKNFWIQFDVMVTFFAWSILGIKLGKYNHIRSLREGISSCNSACVDVRSKCALPLCHHLSDMCSKELHHPRDQAFLFNVHLRIDIGIRLTLTDGCYRLTNRTITTTPWSEPVSR